MNYSNISAEELTPIVDALFKTMRGFYPGDRMARRDQVLSLAAVHTFAILATQRAIDCGVPLDIVEATLQMASDVGFASDGESVN